MNVRHSRLGRSVALTVVMSMPLLGMAGVASAKTAKHHVNCSLKKNAGKKACAAGGAGSGGTTTPIEVTVNPNPLVETGQSEIHAVIEVETSPAFAGDYVTISSQQVASSCAESSVFFDTVRTGSELPSHLTINTVLDDDGNATVGLTASDCAPGTDVISADLDGAPYLTALTTLDLYPPAVTNEGLTGYPNDEVETGDTTGTNASGDSDVYAVFYVETLPVYAEKTVEISSSQLSSRCGQGWWFFPGNYGAFTDGSSSEAAYASTTVDDDGNAVFLFKGASCAAGDSQVIADVEAGTHPTYVLDYTILPPAVTI